MDIEFPFDKIKKLHRSVCVKKKKHIGNITDMYI